MSFSGIKGTYSTIEVMVKPLKEINMSFAISIGKVTNTAFA